MSKISFLLLRARAQGGKGVELKQRCSLSRKCCELQLKLEMLHFFFNSSMCFSKISSFPTPTPPLILESDQVKLLSSVLVRKILYLFKMQKWVSANLLQENKSV